jgi:predicted amidohydrolase YtcJ
VAKSGGVAAAGASDAAAVTQVFICDSFVTLEPEQPRCQALAVQGGRIVALGSKDEILAAYTDSTVTDLGAATCVPGFVESHAHPNMMGAALEKVDVTPDATDTMDAVLGVMRTRAAETLDGDWIIARGYDQGNMKNEADRRPLLASDLDTVSTTHLISVVSNSGHTTYVNTLVLQKAGYLDDSVSDPNGTLGNGIIVVDEDGKPTGELQGSASTLVNKIQPRPSPDDTTRHLRLAAAELQSAGLTTVYDMATSTESLPAYQQLSALPMHEFPVRVRMYPTAAVFAPGKPRAIDTPSGFGDDRLRMGGMKSWSDGSLQGYTGFLSKPYHMGARECDNPSSSVASRSAI